MSHGAGRIAKQKMDLERQTQSHSGSGIEAGAGAIATSIAVYLRSFAEVRVQVEPQPYAHIPLRAHGIRVLYRSIFAASLNATNWIDDDSLLKIAQSLCVETA